MATNDVRTSEGGPPESSTPSLDTTKLHALPSEQQDLYILNFTSSLAQLVINFTPDEVSAQQSFIKKEIIKIITLSSPAPTRVIRNNLARTFAVIFEKGDRKTLIESINELTNLVAGAGRSEKELKSELAAVTCLGAIYESAGDSAHGYATTAVTTLVKTLKAVKTHVGFRAAVLKTVGQIFKGVAPSAEEHIAKEAWRAARNAASSDKSSLVQTAACVCLEQLVKNTGHFDNSNDFEKLQNAIWKAIDSSSTSVRHAAARALAAALVKSYSEHPTDSLPKIKKPKRIRTKNVTEGEDEGHARSESPAPSKPITQLSFDITDLLRQLGPHYSKASTSNKARAAIAVCYIHALRGLGPAVITSKYSEIAKHFLQLANSPSLMANRYRDLITRKFTRVVLEQVVGQQLLEESGQMIAAKFLINEVIKDYPQALKERPEPTKQSLIAALSALASLMKSLGAAFASLGDSCREALLQVLQHPSYVVQIHASFCFKAFVTACPQQLLPSITICMNSVNRELNLLAGPRKSSVRCIGFANGLAATLSTAYQQPLYGSIDVYARILSLATNLLKSASGSDLRVSSTQIQVAWILLSGLMTLGPNFVKINLNQLLLLWKNALPKPLNKDHMTGRNQLELSFLTHVRECALGCILTFLEFNARLLTLDVTKRIAVMLQNTAVFLSSLPAKRTTDEPTQRLSPKLQLHEYELMVRRRVLQCNAKLTIEAPAGSSDTLLQSSLLPLAISSFADPENYAPSSLSVSIASSAGNFEGIWDVGDNYGFGLTGLVRSFSVAPLPGEQKKKHWSVRDGPEAEIDLTLLSPICEASEHDNIALISRSASVPLPPATQVVDAAINLFAISLPFQAPKVQESILEQISSFLSSNLLQKDPSRKAAMSVNVATALLGALKVTVKETQLPAGDMRASGVEKATQELLHGFINSPDQYIRYIASEALGRLCSSGGNNFTSAEINYLIEQIVSNREPNVRAGCASALGCAHEKLGSMSAGFHLKNILSILMSLGNDPHPTVHFWAIESLGRVADSAGLTFAGYVSSTLGMLAQTYGSETHNAESALLASSNLEIELNTTAAVAKAVDSVINVLGPDLQDMGKVRDLIMTLIGQFLGEDDEMVRVEALRCMEHMNLYAPGHMEFGSYVMELRKALDSEREFARDIALDGLYNLMRRNPDEVIRAAGTAGTGLEDKLWIVLNRSPQQEVVRNIIWNWLQQTALERTTEWIQKCQNVLIKIVHHSAQPIPETARPATTTAGPDLQDEEVAGFAAAAGQKGDDPSNDTPATQELLKWQVRLFALECLSELLLSVTSDSAAHEESAAEAALQSKIADVVRIAFSASTSGVVDLRIIGLKIIDQVLKLFGRTPDPDFPEASLLEQYQAQIGSALTPAFAADSSPELASQAVNVCATFIATGIVTDVERMGRILRLLVGALENFSNESETVAIGDLKSLSPNAQVMVKMAVLSGWAELQIATTEQKYLADVLRPAVARLTPLWLSSLREYARLRFEPDASSSSGPAALSGNLDTIYAALNRETLLQFYQSAWLNFVDAIASLIDEDSEFVFDALDGRTEATTPGGTNLKPSDINYRDEPVAFFFVLFGLAFEALVTRPIGDSKVIKEQTMELLTALKKILRPSVAGHAIYQDAIFTETMDMLDRLVLTEEIGLQVVVVDIIKGLALAHPSARSGNTVVAEEKLSEDIDQLFELTRILVLVLAGIIPNLTDNRTHARHAVTEESIALTATALSALVDVAAIFPSIIRTDLHACILHIFTTILSTAICQDAIVPQSLPIFKRFLGTLVQSPQSETLTQLRSALARFFTILKNAQKRESEASLPCEKNTLLASTILVTSTSRVLAAGDPLLERYINELTECLDNRMTSKVAANCARSILLLPAKSDTETSLKAKLLPRLVLFVSSPPEIEGLDEAISLVISTLATFTTTLKQTELQAAFAVLIPALLAYASREGRDSYQGIAGRLLELAGVSAVAFRVVVASMEPTQKSFLEEVIRSASSGKKEVVARDTGEPTIALKLDFGG